MKFVFVFLVLLSSLSFAVHAQLRYSVDTFTYHDKEILIRRSSSTQIDSFRRLSRIAFQLTAYVEKLQKELGEANEAVKDNRTIYEYTLTHAQEIMDQAREFYPAFEMKLYQEELHFYEQYKKDLEE